MSDDLDTDIDTDDADISVQEAAPGSVYSMSDLAPETLALIKAAQAKNGEAAREALSAMGSDDDEVDVEGDAATEGEPAPAAVEPAEPAQQDASAASAVPAAAEVPPAAAPPPAPVMQDDDQRLAAALAKVRPLDVALQQTRQELEETRKQLAAYEQRKHTYGADRVGTIRQIVAEALGKDDAEALKNELKELHDDLTYDLLAMPPDDNRKARREAASAKATAMALQRKLEASETARAQAEQHAREQAEIDNAIATYVAPVIDPKEHAFLVTEAKARKVDASKMVYALMAEAHLAGESLTVAEAVKRANSHFKNEAKRVVDAYASLFAQPAPAPGPAANPAAGAAQVTSAPDVGGPKPAGTSDAPTRSKTLTNTAATRTPTRVRAIDVDPPDEADTLAKLRELRIKRAAAQ